MNPPSLQAFDLNIAELGQSRLPGDFPCDFNRNIYV